MAGNRLCATVKGKGGGNSLACINHEYFGLFFVYSKFQEQTKNNEREIKLIKK